MITFIKPAFSMHGKRKVVYFSI